LGISVHLSVQVLHGRKERSEEEKCQEEGKRDRFSRGYLIEMCGPGDLGLGGVVDRVGCGLGEVG
jgi:hypothetical protein